MTEPLSPEISVETDGAVATIRLERAAKRNAITTAMYATLATSLDRIGADAGIRVVVLTGSGGSFTAGNDLADMRANPDTGDDSPPSRFLRALVALPQVLVIAVDGPAIGVGSTVLLHADLVYATPASIFAMPFVNLGLVPEAASTYLLPALVGHARAAELLLLGRRFSADEALRWGLLNDVVADATALAERVLEVSTALAAQPPAALAATRDLLRRHRTEPVNQRLGEDGALLRALAAAQAGDR